MNGNKAFEKFVRNLQFIISNNKLDQETLKQSVNELNQLGYKYNQKRFPALRDTQTFKDTSKDSPSNLAESLLWKLGKWESYKKFAANCSSENPKPTKTDVVFFAFAKHIKDKSNPIYDQHSIRALWAICGNLTIDESQKLKSLLFNGEEKWKPSGSGAESIECYNLFVKRIKELVSFNPEVTFSEIDYLLMPLGQALKKKAKNYSEFMAFCGMNPHG